MKYHINEVSCLWNVLSIKCPVYKMSCLWNVLSMKFPVYEMSCLWNVLFIKCPVYEMSCLWNVLFMKCPVYEMSCLWNVPKQDISVVLIKDTLYSIKSLVGVIYTYKHYRFFQSEIDVYVLQWQIKGTDVIWNIYKFKALQTRFTMVPFSPLSDLWWKGYLRFSVMEWEQLSELHMHLYHLCRC